MEYKYLMSRRTIGPTKNLSFGRYIVQRQGRFWAVFDSAETLICLTVYKRGALEVVRRLSATKVAS